ncbi:MAG: HD domain-containing protein [Candidatus Diapherotrites archaeon]|nr:HD domain-containing protein [Candidatus Diapherotrites archaeon]
MNHNEAKHLLYLHVSDTGVRRHCEAVASLAYKIAKRFPVDAEKVRIAALLHDIGRGIAHPYHGFVSEKILRDHGEEEMADWVKQHGAAPEEAGEYSMEGYEPQSLESKIIHYADSRVMHDRVVPISVKEEYLKKKYGPGSKTGDYLKKNYKHTAEGAMQRARQIGEELGIDPDDFFGLA